jgi:hypothetical protein
MITYKKYKKKDKMKFDNKFHRRWEWNYWDVRFLGILVFRKKSMIREI